VARHRFDPTRYYPTIGSHEAVLRLADGDTVITSTLDAHAKNAREEVVAEAPNPMTGPFFLEGAEPGDTLVVTLDRLEPNREYGWSAPVLAPNVVDPETVSEAPHREQGVYARWRMDREAGTATLTEPAGSTLVGFSLPLAPMVGCFGVAPPRGQAISTQTSGSFGGNMDYRGFSTGATAYFPVSVPGALFHIGDGHALQGHGEISGTGVEISFDVEFTLRLQKGGGLKWPRGENADYVFAVGNARPLDQATRHATTEMTRWLIEGYGFDPVGARILLGQVVEYEIGNFYNPAYTVVCKVPKRYLG
jgi:amidase